MKLEDVAEKAKEFGSYFLTLTTLDKNKESGNLVHHVIRQEFPTDDIVPSIDAALRSLSITPVITPEVFVPNKIEKEKRPLKIAIITHINRAPESYSPAGAIRNQIKLLSEYGHEVVFFTQEGSSLDFGCETRRVVPKFRREKNVINEDAKKKFIEVLKRELDSSFDLAITHDFYIDDSITYREAIKECGVDIKWLHWARSGVGRPIDFNMPNARYVYMNKSEAGNFAKNISVSLDRIRVIYNIKDPISLFKVDPITKMISDRLKLSEKDIIQTYPMCTTRMAAKGINDVINVFGEIKKTGKRVALIVCNSNGRKRIDEINSIKKYAESVGLGDGDFVFTSTLADNRYQIDNEVPHAVVNELFRLSNLFVFPSRAEVCSNVLLEASLAKNLIVINKDVPCLADFVDENASFTFPFTSNQSIHYSGKNVAGLVKDIIFELDNNKNDKQFRYTWRNHSRQAIYENQLKPIIYEGIDK